jgi:hypothetical protein
VSLQTIIDNATYVEFDIREQSGSTISRSGHYKTADRNVNVYSFTVGMHNGLTYSTNRSVIQDIYTTGSTTEANISLNNNSGMNYLTNYQGSLSSGQQAEVTLNSTFGSEIYVDQTGITGNTSGYTYLVRKGDFIQPKGNTDTYRYPYQVTSDVAFNIADSNTTIPVHRPILSQTGVALTSGGIKVGNDVRWQVKITNLPKYTIVPHDLLQFTDDFELIEVIT